MIPPLVVRDAEGREITLDVARPIEVVDALEEGARLAGAPGHAIAAILGAFCVLTHKTATAEERGAIRACATEAMRRCLARSVAQHVEAEA